VYPMRRGFMRAVLCLCPLSASAGGRGSIYVSGISKKNKR
jgi:hypothetical protein